MSQLLSEAIPMRCSLCGSYDVATSPGQYERGDVEMVQCAKCGNVTDAYEAMKQAESRAK